MSWFGGAYEAHLLGGESPSVMGACTLADRVGSRRSLDCRNAFNSLEFFQGNSYVVLSRNPPYRP